MDKKQRLGIFGIAVFLLLVAFYSYLFLFPRNLPERSYLGPGFQQQEKELIVGQGGFNEAETVIPFNSRFTVKITNNDSAMHRVVALRETAEDTDYLLLEEFYIEPGKTESFLFTNTESEAVSTILLSCTTCEGEIAQHTLSPASG